jgi:hypothetical protein
MSGDLSRVLQLAWAVNAALAAILALRPHLDRRCGLHAQRRAPRRGGPDLPGRRHGGGVCRRGPWGGRRLLDGVLIDTCAATVTALSQIVQGDRVRVSAEEGFGGGAPVRLR